MERQLKLWWSLIPPISTTRILTSYLKSLNTNKTTTYDVGRTDPGLGQALKCGGCRSVWQRNSKILVSLKTKINVYQYLQKTSVYHSHVIMEGPVIILLLDLIVIANQDGMWQHIVEQVNMISIYPSCAYPSMKHVLLTIIYNICLSKSD
jgi:hypothetical protein